MSVPLSRIRPAVGSWKRATRSVTVVLPAPLRPTSATTDPPGAVTLKSRTTGLARAVLELHVLEAQLLAPRAGRRRASGRSGLSGVHRQHFEHPLHRGQRALQLGEGVDDVPHRVQQQERVPLERHDVADRRAAAQVQVAAVPHDHDVDAAQQQVPRGPDDHLAALREELLAQHGVAPAHVLEQLVDLPAERPHHADARERLAHPAVDLAPRPCAATGRWAGCASRR